MVLLPFIDTEWPDGYQYIDADKLSVLVQFVANKNGKITNIECTKGDEILAKRSEKSFQNLANWLFINDKLIQPAQMENGEQVSLIFQKAIIIKNPMSKKQRQREKKRFRQNL